MIVRNSSWNDFYSQGIQYMAAVERSVSNGDFFTPVLVYNITAIAIEKLIIGACMFSGNIPYSHTLSEMAGFAKNIINLDDTLADDLNTMDRLQMICSFDESVKINIEKDNIPFFLDVMKRIFEKTESYISSMQ